MISFDERKKVKTAILKILTGSLVIFGLMQCSFESGKTTKPEEVGLSSQHLRLLDGIIQEAIGRKDFPGAVIVVGRKGKIVFRKAYGESQWVPQRRRMDATMIFDLASLTKPIGTATSIMILVEQGRVSLDEKVKDYIPEFAPYVDEAGKPGEDARLWHLLTHTSGLPPYFPPEANAEAVENTFGKSLSTEQLVNFIARLPKTDPRGAAFHYSCLGYITLAHILKKITGQNIAEFSSEQIFKPLGMKHTFYNPPQKYRSACVPTEVVGGTPLVGIVHDPLARLQGGISGNAGLFSTADDLAIFAQMMLNQGEDKGVRILSPLSVARMTSIWQKAPAAGRGLGWDLSSSLSTNGGDLFGPHSYGHTGYTGTSIWIDPDTDTFVIFLTNRVHPDDKGEVIAMRSRVANVVASSILAKTPGSR
jgi:CubicO group peptidase (beta-lactamase class C family)